MRTAPASKLAVAPSGTRRNEPGNGVVARGGAGCNGVGPSASLLVSLVTRPSWQSGSGDRLAVCSEEVCVLAEDREVEDVEALTDEDVDELLVEEVSIDGMCGVY
jgi:mycofactocin precursor